MSEIGKRKRKTWNLRCYAAIKEEFVHSRKNKFGYANVLEDMVCQRFTDTSATTATLEGKMRTLLQAYRSAKDNANKTGAAPCRAPYIEEMDEICDEKPIISNEHTVNLGRGPIDPLEDIQHFEETFAEDELETLEPTAAPVTISPILSPLPQAPIVSTLTPSPSASNSSPTVSQNASLTSNFRCRKTVKERYHETKLVLKRKHAARHGKFYDDITKSMRVKTELEKEKIKLLEKVLNCDGSSGKI